MSVSVVVGLDSVEAVAKKLQGLPEALGQAMLERVQSLTPVRTGVLRTGWAYQVDGYKVTVGNAVEYAVYVELGTRYMAPRGMLRTTLFEVPQMVQQYLEAP